MTSLIKSYVVGSPADSPFLLTHHLVETWSIRNWMAPWCFSSTIRGEKIYPEVTGPVRYRSIIIRKGQLKVILIWYLWGSFNHGPLTLFPNGMTVIMFAITIAIWIIVVFLIVLVVFPTLIFMWLINLFNMKWLH